MKTNPSPGATMRDTILSVEPNQDPVYGSWPEQQIMGIRPCTITAEEAPDGDERFVDALGQRGVFCRGGLAIHVSGKDNFGHPDGAGRILAMAMHQIHWPPHARNIPSGLGCRAAEPAIIVSADPDERIWGHHAHYSPPRHFWTLEGIWRATRDANGFTPRDLCELHNAAFPLSYTKYEKTQERSARRLLDVVVGLSNHGIEGQPVLLRGPGRWAYHWSGGR